MQCICKILYFVIPGDDRSNDKRVRLPLHERHVLDIGVNNFMGKVSCLRIGRTAYTDLYIEAWVGRVSNIERVGVQPLNLAVENPSCRNLV
jgi:hypothetical protein